MKIKIKLLEVTYLRNLRLINETYSYENFSS